MNASQFGVDDERILLETIYNELKKKKQKTKIVFVVNKIDQLDIEANEIPLNLIKNIKRYLKTLGFNRPNVIPVMSLLSLEIRQILNSYEATFSKRKEKKLLKDLDYLLDFEDDYLKAIMNTPSKKKFYEQAKIRNRKLSSRDNIELAGRKLSIEQLIKADVLTGIPILEEMLEVELIKDSEKFVINSSCTDCESTDVFKSKVLAKSPRREELLGILAATWIAPVKNFGFNLHALKEKNIRK